MRINTANETKITVAIETAEGKSTARTLSHYRVLMCISDVEEKLAKLEIPKKYWKGFTFSILPEELCNSYKWNGEGTFAKIERGSNGWFMVKVDRIDCGKGGRGVRSQFKLTDEMVAVLPEYYTV